MFEFRTVGHVDVVIKPLLVFAVQTIIHVLPFTYVVG